METTTTQLAPADDGNDAATAPGGVPLADSDRHHPVEEGDDLSILFALLLHHMEMQGYMGRMPQKPRVAESVDRFHSQFWPKFLKGVDSPWASLTSQQKTRHVRSWLFRKFTMDPRGECMLPGPGAKRKHRNEASWKGFTLTDAELDKLVQSVMGDYFQAVSRQDGRCHGVSRRLPP